MKWMNKGHEFDELGHFFQTNNKIVIIGSSEEENSALKKKLDFLDVSIETTAVLPAKKTKFSKLLYKLLLKLPPPPPPR
jgi:hypothetical protein